ncbi:hypothetical protein [Streptomyces shenzhenensis]|uniref:hypothetical protein n=1 Tax=Streptomyces shenzhenensis TaxID=943815 RepID=UPI0015F0D0BD|nr:hypothetical protein [Streptomyces shenzhenensis]
MATVIGVRLPVLHRYAPAFTAAHRAALYRIVPDCASPAASWLRWGPPSPPLLAALDRADLLGVLRDAEGLAPDAAAHTAAALLADPAVLGEPRPWWTELAGGAAAVSRVLEAVAISGVKFHDVLTVSLGGVGTITNVINDTGAVTSSGTTPTDVVSYP